MLYAEKSNNTEQKWILYYFFFFFKGMVVCCVIQTGSELLDSSGLPASASGVIGTISP